MGVSTVNTTNQADLVKLALAAKQGKTSSTGNAIPTWMTSNGSVFNAPGVNSNTTSATSNSSIQNLNTLRSLNNLNNTNSTSAANKNSEGK